MHNLFNAEYIYWLIKCSLRRYQSLTAHYALRKCTHMNTFWFSQSIAKMVRRVQQWNTGQPQDVTALLQAMGAQEHDKSLLEFWGTSAI